MEMKHFLVSCFGCVVSLFASAETITLDIPDESSFANWTVIDANDDGTIWGYKSSSAMYHSGNRADDWLNSPAVELTGGVKYDISALLKVDTSTPRYSFHDFTVYIGNAPTVDAQTNEIVEQTGAEYSLDPKSYSGTFTPEADGTFYVSVHCTSSGWNDDLYFYNFTIDANAPDEEVQTKPLPYSEDFSTSDHGYTFCHVNSESRDWDISSQRLRYYGKNYYTSDAYAITPAFRFEAGKSYELSFTTWISSSSTSSYKPLSVKIGNSKNTSDLTKELYSETIQTTSQTKKTVKFSVEEDGVYYLAFYCGGDLNANDIFVDDVNLKEIVTAPLAVTALAVTPAAMGAMEATVSWVNPSKTNVDTDLESISKAVVSRDGVEIAMLTEGLKVGEPTTFVDANLSEAGKYEYSVVVYLGENPSQAATVTSPWIGKDTEVGNVSDVKAEVIDDHTVSLTFTPVTVGINGGYVDPADVAYRIDRKAGSNNAETIEDAYTGELPYIDSNVNGLNSYQYSVYTIYQGENMTSTFAPPTSNDVILGGAMDVPYSQDFTDTNNHFFTFFHGEGSTRNWTVSSSKYLDYWGNPADAYAVTPGINLEAGKAYELSFSTWRTGTEKPLYVRLGKEASADGLDTQLFYENIDNGISSTRTVTFSVAEDGVYYVGFHCFGTVDSYNDLYVDNITIKEIPVAPLAAVDFTATAGEKGALTALLEWTNPTENNAGGELSAISKAVIKRGNSEIATIEENLTPGLKATFADETIPEAGKYTYSITLYLGDNESETVTASTEWVGIDTPKPLENAVATLGEDGKTMTITWDAVSETGVNGGYVDIDAVTYSVVRRPDGYEVAAEVAGNSVTDNVEAVSLGMYFYEISIDQYPDLAATTEKTQLGDAIEVTFDTPYLPDFSSADTFELWTLTNGGEGTGMWKYNEKDETLETGFIFNQPYAFTAPLKMRAGTYKVKYKATCYSARYTSNMEIYVTDAPTHEAEYNKMIHSAKVESVSFPNAVEVEFEIPQTGVYYVGYRDVTADHWKLALSQADVELVEIDTTALESAVSDAMQVKAGIGVLTILGAAEGTAVYSIDGKLVAICGEGTNQFNLVPGVYIVKGAREAVKAAVR